MSDALDLNEPPPAKDPGVNFFLGQLSGRLESLAKESDRARAAAESAQSQAAGLPGEVAKLLGPRLQNMEGRITKLEGWRTWLTGASAAFGFIIICIEVWRSFPK